MKSPFPGMDPYVEASDLWEDFHDTLIAALKDAISDVLPRGYVARMGKRSYLVTTARTPKASSPRVPAWPTTQLATLEMEPVDLRAQITEEFEEKFLDIYELQPERRLVTSIEVLSPTNKRRGSEGWQQYLRKRQALLLGLANLVEIDLLRGGERMPMLDPWPSIPYVILVARQEAMPRCRVWPAFFDRPLPPLLVPLAKPHPDIVLELQPLIEIIYQRGRYSADVDYARPLDPPLTPAEAAWLKERLRASTRTQTRKRRR